MAYQEIPFPLKGYNKNWAFSKQPELTTPIIKNMRPYDTLNQRARGGSSPDVSLPSLNTVIKLFEDEIDYSSKDNYAKTEEQRAFAPDDCSLGAAYRGRLMLSRCANMPTDGPAAHKSRDGIISQTESEAGEPGEVGGEDEYQWYMSRQGDPYDWNYAANDAQSPVAGNSSDAGSVPDIPTALAPYSDDYVIIGCEKSIWVLRGDPATGGAIENVFDHDGILGSNAWCFDSHGNFYFAARSGLYRMPRGLGPPENLSHTKIPDIFRGLDNVRLHYDSLNEGVVIRCGDAANRTSREWSSDEFYMNGDVIKYNGSCYLCSAPSGRTCYGNPTDLASHFTEIGCPENKAGVYSQYWYDFRTEGFFPEDWNVSTSSRSRVMYGPISLGGTDAHYGRLRELLVTYDGSDTVYWEVYTANSALELHKKVANESGSDADGDFGGELSDGRQSTIRLSDDTVTGSVVGTYAAIYFYSDGEFSIDRLEADIQPITTMLYLVNHGRNQQTIEASVDTDQIIFGSFDIAGHYRYGKVNEITVTRINPDVNITCYVYTGNSELAVDAAIARGAPDATITFSSRHQIARPKVRGRYLALKFSTTNLSSVTVNVITGGRIK